MTSVSYRPEVIITDVVSNEGTSQSNDEQLQVETSSNHESNQVETSSSHESNQVETSNSHESNQVEASSNAINASAVQPVLQPASTVHYAPAIKLPKLVLPKFKGDITNYRTFWESFQSAVHRNSYLTNIDKFNYLLSL